MAGLKQIKTKIRSVKKTRTVTKAMEAVSAVKMRKAQSAAVAGRAYARAASSVLARVAGSRSFYAHPLSRVALDSPRVLYIVITSDKGLAGALNSGVLRAAHREIGTNTKALIVAVGRKAHDYFSKRGFEVVEYHPNTDVITSALIERIVAEAAGRFVGGEIDSVRMVYQNFISTFEQRPTLRTIFPLSLAELEKVVADITPAKGSNSAPLLGRGLGQSPSAYTIEPSEEEVLDVLLPKLAGIMVYHALLESQASEHSARMVAMKSASDKAGELTHALTLKFNKARQAAITREVSEITGGMEAMAA